MLQGLRIVSALAAIGMIAPVAHAQEQAAPTGGDAAAPDATDTGTAAAPDVVESEPPEALRLVEARAQFTAGQAAFDAGAWEPALLAFERAHVLTASPELLYNIAVTSERLGLLTQAVARYEAYVSALPEASDRAEVDSRIRRLRGQLAQDQRARTAAAERERERARQRVAATPRERHDTSSGGLLSQWWFWAAVGTVAAAATVGTVLVLEDGAPAPIPGSNGVVHTALMVGL